MEAVEICARFDSSNWSLIFVYQENNSNLLIEPDSVIFSAHNFSVQLGY